jgi:hypothetical protein
MDRGDGVVPGGAGVTVLVPEIGGTVIRPRADGGRPWSQDGELLPAGVEVRTAGELREHCEAALAELIHTVASWPLAEHGRTWLVSDSTFLIVSFKDRDKRGAYIQFLSTPARDTVLWECDSGQFGPHPAVPNPERDRALRARGFKLARRRPANFVREVAIKRAAAVRKTAGEALEILAEAYGYRGQTALEFKLTAERHALRSHVHTRLTTRQLMFLLDRWGLPVRERKQPRDATVGVLTAGPRGLTFEAILSWPDDNKWAGYARLFLTAAVDPSATTTPAAINRWNLRNAPGRMAKTPDGTARLDCYVPLWLGMTEAHLKGTIEAFFENVKDWAVLSAASQTAPRSRRRAAKRGRRG